MNLQKTISRIALVLPVLAGGFTPRAAAAQQTVADYADVAKRIIAASMDDSAAYRRLSEMVDRFGNRFSGSKSLEDAIDWIVSEMKKDGLQKVRTEPVMVPHWVRGEESLEMVTPRRDPMQLLGLGGSIATPANGIQAEVFVVNSFDDLTSNAAQAKGKIVLFDVPFTNYGETVQYRTGGASAAAKAGAVASLIRSVTPYSQKTPHTGSMRYEDGVAQIPHAAITVEDAMMLHRMQDSAASSRRPASIATAIMASSRPTRASACTSSPWVVTTANCTTAKGRSMPPPMRRGTPRPTQPPLR
jgi:carboxypeptidase Q